MQDQRNRRTDGGEKAIQRFPIPNVDCAIVEPSMFGLELANAPLGRSFLAEEVAAHVVVYPDDIEAFLDEEFDGLGADQATGTGDDRGGHAWVLWGHSK